MKKSKDHLLCESLLGGMFSEKQVRPFKRKESFESLLLSEEENPFDEITPEYAAKVLFGLTDDFSPNEKLTLLSGLAQELAPDAMDSEGNELDWGDQSEDDLIDIISQEAAAKKMKNHEFEEKAENIFGGI